MGMTMMRLMSLLTRLLNRKVTSILHLRTPSHFQQNKQPLLSPCLIVCYMKSRIKDQTRSFLPQEFLSVLIMTSMIQMTSLKTRPKLYLTVAKLMRKLIQLTKNILLQVFLFVKKRSLQAMNIQSQLTHSPSHPGPPPASLRSMMTMTQRIFLMTRQSPRDMNTPSPRYHSHYQPSKQHQEQQVPQSMMIMMSMMFLLTRLKMYLTVSQLKTKTKDQTPNLLLLASQSVPRMNKRAMNTQCQKTH